jgi:hypothetical protein
MKKFNVSYVGETTLDTGVRYYEGSDGELYPSVTTILSQYQDTTALEEWEEKLGKEEAAIVRDKAAARGRSAHTDIENYLNHRGQVHGPQSRFTEAIIENFYSKVEMKMAEEALFWNNNGLRIAGRFDQLLEVPEDTFTDTVELEYIPGGLYIVDLKTKDKQPRVESTQYILKHCLQSTMYSKMLKDTRGINVTGAIIAYGIGLKTVSRYKLYYLSSKDLAFYWAYMYRILLDYYGVHDLEPSWEKFSQHADCRYIDDVFENNIPHQII